ncbi:BamA/OMP85 family outer membrane protein [Cerasicoccus maritimus]|uniref:BamA/OMP85 family outer membrane protein n=1 Tax=Cerasicoccus maritimus TaxID=490089 RepID=UPI002852B36A|nr:BamA/TamA family outer membrane protein [Cerasicoccus maritimus]
MKRLLLLCLLLAPGILSAGSLFGLIGDPNVTVSGFGYFSDLYLERSLEILDVEGDERKTYDGLFLEDAVWILAGEIKQKGYLEPELDIQLMKDGEVVFESVWTDGDLEPNPPRDVEGDEVDFRVRAGLLYYFNTITVEGLPADMPSRAASYFYTTDQLVVSEKDRYFTEGRFQAGLNRIVQTLKDLGYRKVEVTAKRYEIDDETGQVNCSATVKPGPIFYTNEMEVLFYYPEEAETTDLSEENVPANVVHDMSDDEVENAVEGKVQHTRDDSFAEKRLTPDWVVLEVQTLRREGFAKGFPETHVEVDFEVVEETEERVFGKLILSVYPGAHAELNSVRFEGAGDVAPWLLEQQANGTPGQPLNRTAVEEGRSRLSRLGIFRRVQINYEEVEPGKWDVIYELTPKGKTEVDLIFGVGSFDIVRGGFEVERNNLWGIAHRADLRVVQSFKATYGDVDYWIPQLFGQDLDFFSNINYLHRKELTFDREEWGARAGFQHFIQALNINSSVSYSLENVKATNRDFLVPPGPLEARIGALGFKFVQSDLDSPVFPTDGYHWYFSTEFARPFFGGDVNYDSLEFGGAYHHPLGDFGLTGHLGFKHGVITTSGSPSQEIPVNRRFFLGGENTVRGYKRDQASPVNAQGQQIGAVSYMLFQAELEQRINETFSIVAFVDTVGNAAQISDYPFNEVLISVGGGISIRTIVGPLRFEYGYNVKKRPIDPDGRFQVGLGFPF